MQLALYEPDIPQNTGTILRLCACLGVDGASDRAGRLSHHRPPLPPLGHGLSRSVTIERHASFAAFDEWRRQEGLRLDPVLDPRRDALSGPFLQPGRHPAVRPGIGRCAGPCPRLPPMRGCSSRCSRACARSMWRWRPPWPWARRCGKLAAQQSIRRHDLPTDTAVPDRAARAAADVVRRQRGVPLSRSRFRGAVLRANWRPRRRLVPHRERGRDLRDLDQAVAAFAHRVT